MGPAYQPVLLLLSLWLHCTIEVSALPFNSDTENGNEHILPKRKAFDSLSGYTFGKRNFDEIDRARFSAFHKRNFDEIDRAGFGSFHKRNFDELDKNGFGAFNRYF